MKISARKKANGDLKKNRVLDVNYRAVVSRADLVYLSPVDAAVEGQPVGNGRMGTMVWTTPSAVHLQINRSDVFAVNKNHAGRFCGPTDYCGACAEVTIEVGGELGDKPFRAGGGFRQQLSLYEAENSVVGEGVCIRCFVSAATDVLAMEIDDQRTEPQPVRVLVFKWFRAPEVKTGDHVARYEFVETANRLLLVQQFTEKDYYCASAVAVEVVGSETEVPASSGCARIIIAPPKKGKRTILISSAASWSPRTNVGAAAVRLLKKASEQPYDDLREKHARWWSAFWSRTFVHLSSADGVADFVERLRTLHLYFMASSSRGTLPPKWNGSLFITEGDARLWGSQFWVWTTEMLYFPLFAADAIDLTEPYFNMYLKQLPDCKKAAEQRWGAKGAFYPETTSFDGPVVLPEDVAREFQDVFLGRRVGKLSKRAQALCQFEGHLYAVAVHPLGIIGHYTCISHIASSGSELAVQAWWRYRYTGDTGWLRTHAYPLLRETVEFYRHLVERGEDGRYHIHGTNDHEDFWGVKNGIIDLAAIRGTAPLAIQAAKILKVDEEMCAKWKELLDNLAPYPMGSDPQSMALTGGVLASDVWAAGHLGDVDGSHGGQDIWLNPIFPFEDWTLETRNPETDRIVQDALALAPQLSSILNGVGCGTAIRTPIVCSRAGRGDKLPSVLMSYYAGFSPLKNGLSLFEGRQDSSSEHLGCISTTVQEGLLQSVSARPGEPEVINVLPSWPKEWNASFRLLARGGFLVTASVRNGEVEFVEIESRLGEPCRLRNPWKKPCLVTEIGGAAQELSGEILCFKSGRNKSYLVLPKGRPTPKRRRLSPKPSTGPVSWSYTLPNGTELHSTLGRI